MNELLTNKDVLQYIGAGITAVILLYVIFKSVVKLIEALGGGNNNSNDNKELLAKYEEQINLTKQLINGNKKLQEQFDSMLKKAVTLEQVERVIYNLKQFLEK